MDRGRHALIGMLVVGCLASRARAEKEAPVPDIAAEEAKALRAKGVLLHDGKQHYILMASPDPVTGTAMFYGDGKTFYRLLIDVAANDRTERSWAIVDERRGRHGWMSELSRKDGAYAVTCRSTEDETTLTMLPESDGRALLAKAAFKERLMDRRPYLLGRDGTTYYYADVASTPEDTDYRLYVGKRGAMKRLKIKHIASDSDGLVLTVPQGTLRYRIDPEEASWTAKAKKPVVLSFVDLLQNGELIYNELGVYVGKRFGVPCDDM